MPDYAHLHSHTSNSFFDGAMSVDQYAAKIADLGMEGAALTDHGVLYGWPSFQEACEKQNIKPVLGVEAYIVRDVETAKEEKDKTSYHQVLLAKNQTGLQNIIELMSWANDDGFYYRPLIDLARLQQHSEGVIATSSCMQGLIPQTLLDPELTSGEKIERALKLTEWYRAVFGSDFYFEAHRHGIDEEEFIIQGLRELSRITGVPVITANDCHYAEEGDYDLQDAIVCMSMSKGRDTMLVDDTERERYAHKNLYVKGAAEMADLIPEFPDAPELTMEILEQCDANLALHTGEYHFPNYPFLKDDLTAHEQLTRKCGERFLGRYPNPTQQHKDRIRYELDVIEDMGFSTYFLTVADLVQAAKNKGIDVGPGRGSAAGSIVCYVLGITDIDPLEHDLLFERFLNPHRQTMPDIDIDFDDNRRDEMFDYLRETYGDEHTAHIITFSTLSEKSGIKQFGRVMGVGFRDLNRLTDDLEDRSLDEALEADTELAARYESDDAVQRTVDFTRQADGFRRNTGIHAAGMVVTPGKLTDYIPTARVSSNGKKVKATQFDMDYVEAMGLVKMDVLSLKTLRVIRNTIDLVKTVRGETVDEEAMKAHDDPSVYRDIFAEGLTLGIFQFESPGMRQWLKKLKPTELNDLIAMNSLYRPGPMKLIPDYIRRKYGKEKVEYFHPDVEDILAPTYGIMVYQEQVMQVLQRMAGFSMGKADITRRAIGKKKEKLLDEQKKDFVKGCRDNGISEDKANEVFGLIEEFAGYGFNKSHAAAYSAIAYQTGWLKKHYPVAFYSAAIEAETKDEERAALIQEAKRMGITMRPPSVNKSQHTFAPDPDDSAIRFGLQRIKQVGKQSEVIITEREQGGEYRSFFDLCERALPNAGALKSLILAGACDDFGLPRSIMYEKAGQVMKYARKLRDYHAGDRKSKPERFELIEDGETGFEWPDHMKYAQEKEVAGTYTSGHPLDPYDEIVDTLDGFEATANTRRGQQHYVLTPAVIESVKEAETKAGNPMWWVTYSDGIRQSEEPVFQWDYKKMQAHLKDGARLALIRKEGQGEYAGSYNITAAIPLDRVMEEWAEVWFRARDQQPVARQP
jgi:DNA polymerase-3 subunit alpha